MAHRIIPTIATAMVSIAAIVIVLNQCRKPRWWPGRFFLWMMHLRHSAVTNWGLSHLEIEKHFTILDVGCGGGTTIHRLAGIAGSGKVFGIDYSATSVAAARQRNATAIAAGHVNVQQASVSRLPFPDNTFDLVSAIETHYYWPKPTDDMREILRVLKPGGRLAVIAEAYKDEGFNKVLAIPMKLLRACFLTAREHRELFIAAGFADVAIHEDHRKGWICGIARKPVATESGERLILL